jgi:hypothetical protein
VSPICTHLDRIEFTELPETIPGCEDHSWHVPLYVDTRGLTTRRMHHRGTTFEITFDFVDHDLVVATADGRAEAFELRDGLAVADFGARLHRMLADLGIDDWSDSVLEESTGWFCGKTSPVHLFWHGLDLAVARYSGRPAPAVDADHVTQEAYSREVIAFGFWAGDDNVGDAAYYSYTSPEPEGLSDQPLSAGEWIEFGPGSLAVLPYETVRTAPDPRTTLLAFCQSAYEAGSRLAGWDTAAFESAWCPTPSQLNDLHASAAVTFGRAPATPDRSAP